MLYTVRHRTTFRYEQMVSISHHLLHLTPRSSARQQCLRSEISVDPAPAMHTRGEDYFGNATRHLTISEPHDRFVVEASSLVDVHEDSAGAPHDAGPAWEDVALALESPAVEALEAYEYVFDSQHAVADAAIHDYALRSFTPRRPLLDAAMDLTARIFSQFEYRGGVSDVATPVAQVLSMRRGVCQDFAHLQIACLRSLGLPARYVSGYLLTHPPEGQGKLVGADASHAWLSVWSPSTGWVDFDPTNNAVPGVEHITVGWGRDYGDVSPINGFIVGGGKHAIAVAVDVNRAPGAG